jgi:hypothetical protein
VYRGNPFVVECGLAYGGELPAEEPAEVLRFANRVPLQYQPKACAISEAVYELNWKNYRLSQPRGSLPVAPMAIFIHLASVWVPFTSEAKEAVAHYPELLREITLALQECGRKLAQSLRAHARLENEAKRRSLFERYIPELGQSLAKITGDAREHIETMFYKALPNFVKTLPAPESGGEPPEGTPPAPSTAAAADVEGETAEAEEAPSGGKAKRAKKPAKPAKKEEATAAPAKSATKADGAKAPKLAASQSAPAKRAASKPETARPAGKMKKEKGSPKGEQLELLPKG